MLWLCINTCSPALCKAVYFRCSQLYSVNTCIHIDAWHFAVAEERQTLGNPLLFPLHICLSMPTIILCRGDVTTHSNCLQYRATTIHTTMINLHTITLLQYGTYTLWTIIISYPFHPSLSGRIPQSLITLPTLYILLVLSQRKSLPPFISFSPPFSLFLSLSLHIHNSLRVIHKNCDLKFSKSPSG